MMPMVLPHFFAPFDQFVVESLMIAFGVIVDHELGERFLLLLRAEDDHSVEALGFQATEEAFHVCVAISSGAFSM